MRPTDDPCNTPEQEEQAESEAHGAASAAERLELSLRSFAQLCGTLSDWRKGPVRADDPSDETTAAGSER